MLRGLWDIRARKQFITSAATPAKKCFMLCTSCMVQKAACKMANQRAMLDAGCSQLQPRESIRVSWSACTMPEVVVKSIVTTGSMTGMALVPHAHACVLTAHPAQLQKLLVMSRDDACNIAAL